MHGLPLYDKVHAAPPVKTVPRGNFGLAYDKFGDTWDVNGKTAKFQKTSEGGRQGWLERFSGQLAGQASLLEEHACRRHQLVDGRQGQTLWFAADWVFVSGLGRSHPMENGFAWHHALGVPYLPGSGVKGVLRAWALESGLEPEKVERIFGPRSAGKDSIRKAKVGSILFFDALPFQPVKLRAEVMTNHYGDWYGTSAESHDHSWPADWISPVPIPFLAVEPGTVFGLSTAKASPGTPDEDLDWVLAQLPEALSELGAGAKTAVGYGRFTKMDEAPADFQKVLDRWRMSPEEKAAQALAGNEAEAFRRAYLLFEAAKKGEPFDQRARATLALVPFCGHWAHGDAQSPEVRSCPGGQKTLKAIARFLRGEDPVDPGARTGPAKSVEPPRGGSQEARLAKLDAGSGVPDLLVAARLAVQHSDWSAPERIYLHDLLNDKLKGAEKKKHRDLLRKLKRKKR